MATQSLVLSSISTGMVVFLTVSTIGLRAWPFALRQQGTPILLHTQQLYQSKDGTASAQSQARYNAVIKVRSIVVLVTSLWACLVALAGTILEMTLASEGSVWTAVIGDWLRAASWILILLLAMCVRLGLSPGERYTAGLSGAGAVFIVTIVSVAHGTELVLHSNASFKYAAPRSVTVVKSSLLALSVSESLLGLISLISFLSIPRCPELYLDNGQVVDREYMVSAISHYTFQWITPLFDVALLNETVNAVDLPGITHAAKSETVYHEFVSSHHAGPLWRRILYTHLRAFLTQWALTLLQSVLQFVPQLSLYKLLRQLELRQVGDAVTSAQIMWCAALGLGLLLHEWVQARLYWIVFAQLAVPIRAQLSTLLFAKTLRRKNVSGARATAPTPPKVVIVEDNASNEDRNPSAQGGVENESLNTSTLSAGAADEANAIAAAKKSSQAAINLVGVDTTRVADFCSLNCLPLNTVFKACISSAFLLCLIGWGPLLAGLCSFALITPLTTVMTKRYSVVQKALMAVRDERLGIVTEALTGIRGIKFAALESTWEAKIAAVRERELDILWRICVIAALLAFLGMVGPLLLSTVSLTVYVFLHRRLTPSVAFTTLTVLSSLESAIGLFPLIVAEIVDAMVSTNRIHDYLEAPEREPYISHAENISLKDVLFSWPAEDDANDGRDQFVLQVDNIILPRGELTLVSGKTGSGKSLFLAALIGECELLRGTITMPRPLEWSDRHNSSATMEEWILPGSVAFVPQAPWMENMSIEENILFGQRFDKARYEETLSACSLNYDLEELPDGDKTEIGANGINLSGGQRWRVALARAVYSRAEILVLDDIFSAVDANVGAWILEHALTGPLVHGRTRILATHHLALVASKATYRLTLADGCIVDAGPVLPEFVDDDVRNKVGTNNTFGSASVAQKTVNESDPKTPMSGSDKSPESRKPKAFVQEEQRKSGVVAPNIALGYFKSSSGILAWAACLIVFIAAQILLMSRSWWVKIWTSSYAAESVPDIPSTSSSWDIVGTTSAYQLYFSYDEIAQGQRSISFYLTIYAALSIAACLAGTAKQLYLSRLTLSGARALFTEMLHTILRTPLRWIDTVPTGRILNRFTADFAAVDSRMRHDLEALLSSTIQILFIIAAGMIVSPIVIVFGVVLIAFALRLARRYMAAARAVKRLDSVAKSPVFEQFGSALVGLSTIRAFGTSSVYVQRMYGLIDGYTTTTWNIWLCNRWLGFHIGLLGVVATVIVAVLIVSMSTVDAALAGFALSFTLEFSTALNWILRRYANTELIMNSVERIHEYTELPTEPESGISVPASWPSKGGIVVRDLVAGYDKDAPPVLKGVSFEVGANQRVGIVGRTGAGKSSLMYTLFRLLQAQSGSISIDGIDISKVKLHDLRSRMSIIPQDPGLFAGTVRSNLDPLDRNSDIQLQDALRRVHLTQNLTSLDSRGTATPKSTSSGNVNIFENLYSPISEGGLNLSQGQRQLLCLARVLVTQPKIMILDEATSAVDMQTDTLIQRTLREEFANTTMIVIAHRLSTVADFDKIMVMGDGMVQEFGTPEELRSQKGKFWHMLQDSGHKDGLERVD